MEKMADDEILTYVHYYTEQATYLDHGKIFGVVPFVGHVVKRYVTEGYEPWEIVKIEQNGTVFKNRSLIKATVKIHPRIKTHCNHEWTNPRPITITQVLARHCEKCKIEEAFNYALGKWENKNAT